MDRRTKRTNGAVKFGRCRRALSLPLDPLSGQDYFGDASDVQAVLRWLDTRVLEKRWLVVVDNADDLTWNLSCIIPEGQAGSVIVTSQDGQASQLLGWKNEVLKVDVMDEPEAISLLLSAVNEDLHSASNDLKAVATRIVMELDRLPLAVDLAGARIRSDVDDGEEVSDAMQQYLTDFQRHQDRLLQEKGFVQATSYNKTVWTVWETSLVSLKSVQETQPGICPIQFLMFLTFLDRANIQTELFRLASKGVQEVCARVSITLPSWLRSILALNEDMDWDDFYYRETIKPLLRFGLVRRTHGQWPGLTMHSLVRWRAAIERDEALFWPIYADFCAAACFWKADETSNVYFRRHILTHLPQNERLIVAANEATVGDAAWRLLQFGRIYEGTGRWKESRELSSAAQELCLNKLGPEHPDTLTTMAHLASTYWKQGRWKEAKELQVKVMEARSRVLGEEHPDTLSAIANLAATYWKQGRWKEAEELEVKVMESTSRVMGEEHPDTLNAIANLAAIYRDQGRWQEAEELEVKVMEATSRVMGEKHPDTLNAIANLAAIYRDQGRCKEAEDLQVKVMEATSRVLGEEHPDTLNAIANLAATYWKQGRWKEAEDLQVKVMEARSRVLGEEHPDTLSAMADLAANYSEQRRWKEAEGMKAM